MHLFGIIHLATNNMVQLGISGNARDPSLSSSWFYDNPMFLQ